MYSIARLGLDDMWPALTRAFNDDPQDDKLEKVYGRHPRLNVIALAAAGIVIGELLEFFAPVLAFDGHVNLGAVIVGGSFALLIRRYLFDTEFAEVDDFPWLAASLIPAATLLVVIALVGQFIDGSVDALNDAPGWTLIGALLVALVNALGVAAALTIAVAALCYSRNWLRAVKDLAIQLFIFKLMVAITVLVIVEIGIVGPILASIIESVFDISFPSWLADFFDQLTYAGLLLVAYSAVVGAAWTVCRESFGTLLAAGEANILATMKAMAKRPKKPKAKKKPGENEGAA